MDEEYERRHGIKQKLKEWKEDYRNEFDCSLQICKKEIFVAESIVRCIERLLVQTIKRRMPILIVDQIVNHFSNTKYHLTLAILETLISEDCFEHYKLYLQNPKSFTLKWITDFTDKKIFEGKTFRICSTSKANYNENNGMCQQKCK
jgi:hypothetical protein